MVLKSLRTIFLFQKSLSDPSEAVPAAEEYEAADVLVEGEDGPHGNESPSEADAEDVTAEDCGQERKAH